MKLKELMDFSNKILSAKGIESAGLDTRLLLCKWLGKEQPYLFSHREEEFDDPSGFFALLHRRADFEPMQYILGTAEFMGLAFAVNPHVLIPRPDTETLVSYAVQEIADSPARLFEIGTGSGCIVISILKACPHATAVAAELSAQALEAARQNAAAHGVEKRVRFVQMDILKDFITEETDWIVSNPPYIPHGDIPSLMPDVRLFEPHAALDGGADGLDFYRRIVPAAKGVLRRGGRLAFEVGHTQSAAVQQLMRQNGFRDVTALHDLAGIERVVAGVTA